MPPHPYIGIIFSGIFEVVICQVLHQYSDWFHLGFCNLLLCGFIWGFLTLASVWKISCCYIIGLNVQTTRLVSFTCITFNVVMHPIFLTLRCYIKQARNIFPCLYSYCIIFSMYTVCFYSVSSFARMSELFFMYFQSSYWHYCVTYILLFIMKRTFGFYEFGYNEEKSDPFERLEVVIIHTV